MKKLILLSLLIVQACFVFAQNCCKNDSAFKELQFPLTVQDTQTVFYYFNNEWIAEANPDMVGADSILKMEVKNDEYGNRAVFITISSEDFEKLKSDVKEATKNFLANYDPICEFPGGNGLLKEWLEANIQIPDGYKGNERVIVSLYVQPDGTVTDAYILRPSKNEAANAEALRLVNALPKFRVKFFTPKKHRIAFTLPITFQEPGAIYIRGNETE
ncbi:MAG: energy transducer TonB [Odoribacter sp.]|nr:energy transducer TonB [Odoribacter sp.]